MHAEQKPLEKQESRDKHKSSQTKEPEDIPQMREKQEPPLMRVVHEHPLATEEEQEPPQMRVETLPVRRSADGEIYNKISITQLGLSCIATYL